MPETALVSDNAVRAEERVAILEAVGEVLGVAAVHKWDRFLESAEPPLQVVIDAFSVLGTLAALYTVAGGPTMAELYRRVRKIAPGRKVDVHFEAHVEEDHSIQYITGPETPDEALSAIIEDSKREVPDPKSFRWWYNRRWMTHVEYREWKDGE